MIAKLNVWVNLKLLCNLCVLMYLNVFVQIGWYLWVGVYLEKVTVQISPNSNKQILLGTLICCEIFSFLDVAVSEELASEKRLGRAGSGRAGSGRAVSRQKWILHEKRIILVLI